MNSILFEITDGKSVMADFFPFVSIYFIFVMGRNSKSRILHFITNYVLYFVLPIVV